MHRRTATYLLCLMASAMLLTGCDEGREVQNPFAGPSHGPERYAMDVGSGTLSGLIKTIRAGARG